MPRKAAKPSPRAQKGAKAPQKSKSFPVAYSTKDASHVATMTSRKQGVIIKHRELAGSISSGTSRGFYMVPLSAAVPGYDINPGTPFMFPWLSNIAPSYERFRFHKLSVELIGSSPTTVQGRVYAAIDYDYNDQCADSKINMMSNLSAVEGPVYGNLKLVADTGLMFRDLPQKYISIVDRTNFSEARCAFGGYFMFAYEVASDNVAHDIFVEYEVELFIPTYDKLLQDQANEGQEWGQPNLLTDYGNGRFLRAIQGANTVAGPIRMALNGTTGTPLMQFKPHGASSVFTPNSVYDISAARGHGSFEHTHVSTCVVDSPAQINSSTELSPDVAVFDQSGVMLSPSLVDHLARAISANNGVYVGQSMGDGGNAYLAKSLVRLATLTSVYPTAKYLAPYIFGTSAGSPSVQQALWRYMS